MSERDLSFRGLLIESYVAEGLARSEAEEVVDALLPPPPDESTIEGWLLARFLEVQTNLVVYGQHPPPPPEERGRPEGITPRGWPATRVWVDEAVDWMPSAVSIATPDDGPIQAILHDPLWNLGRVSVPEA